LALKLLIHSGDIHY